MTTDTDRERALPDEGWLIYKGGRGWYRPNAQGYTSNPAEAGRYSREDALSYSHPNGLDGPRDGLSIRHESEVVGALPPPLPDRERALVEAARELLDAQDAIDNHKAREPLSFSQVLVRRQDALRALSAALAQYQEPSE
jgi:hypothetical protein